jgi:hypothetical protein
MEKYQNLMLKKPREDNSKTYTKDTQIELKNSPTFQVHRNSEGKNIFEKSVNEMRVFGKMDEKNNSFLETK